MSPDKVPLFIVLILLSLDLLIFVSRIGKPRQPITGAEAIGGVIVMGFYLIVIGLAVFS